MGHMISVLVQLAKVRATPPDVIVVVAGGNDIDRWRRTIRVHDWRLLRRIFCEEARRAFPSARIYLVDPLPWPGYYLRILKRLESPDATVDGVFSGIFRVRCWKVFAFERR